MNNGFERRAGARLLRERLLREAVSRPRPRARRHLVGIKVSVRGASQIIESCGAERQTENAHRDTCPQAGLRRVTDTQLEIRV